jgi:two-component system, cell cycle sensor histidine kinase and response regulator CckA
MTDELYEKMVEILPDGVVIHSQGKIVFVNETACRLLRAERREQVVGASVIEFVHPDYRALAMARIVKAMQEGAAAQPEEEVFLTLDGEEVPVLVTALPFSYHGQPAMLTVCTDITERKVAERALQASEARYRGLIELAVDGILLGSHEGVITEANDEMCRIAGVARDDLVGRHIRDVLFTKESLARVPLRFDLLQQGKTVVSQREIVRPDGMTVVVELRTRMMPDGTYQSIYRDISQRLRAEQSMRESELRVQKLESLSVLAGGIAHDFNNLLSGIFGYMDLARLSERPSDRERFLASAMGVIDRARSLTRQLLTFARGGAPAMRPEILSPFLEETVQFSLSGSPVSCRFELPATLWPCCFDRHQVAQVIDNLVRNAEQAMPAGGTVTTAVRNLVVGDREVPPLHEGRYVAISITDTGIGIPKELQSRIFDPFFTTKEKGQGLGLATCYSIVTQHGGAIFVDSAPSRGSTFTIYLPAMDEEERDEPAPQPLAHRGSGGVLVMDDEPFVRDVLSALLRRLGYEVVTAADGDAAVAAYRTALAHEQPFVAAFFDLTVPGAVGGQVAASRLRELGATLPIFVSSGYAAAPIMADPQAYGFTASIAKPFVMKELIQLLSLHVPQRPTSSTTERPLTG